MLNNKVNHTYSLIKNILISFITTLSMCLVNISTVFAITYKNGKIGIGTDTSASETYGEVDVNNLANGLYGQLGELLNGFAGIALITLTLVFVIKCGQLGMSADNARKRSETINGFLWLGISIGLLGFFFASQGVMTIIANMATGNIWS